MVDHLRFSVATGSGRRGAGLGNEVMAWGKSYLAAEALGLRLLRPRWLANQYKLASTLGWPNRTLFLEQAATRCLPRLRVSEEMYRSTGVTDYGDAMVRLGEIGAFAGRSVVMQHSGMWGGYQAIRGARPFLQQQIYAAPGVTGALRMLERGSPLPTIAVHVRLGDFDSQPPGPGQFNAALPLRWYHAAMIALREQMHGEVRFWVCSDAPTRSLTQLLDLPNAELIRGDGPSAAIQDLAVLSAADALICSVSSFSMLAAFLSGRPYVWFRPQLTHVAGGMSIWGQEKHQQAAVSATNRHAGLLDGTEVGRGRAWEEGEVFDEQLLAYLDSIARMREEHADLIYYGVVPAS